MTGLTAGGTHPSMTAAIPRRLIKGPQCDSCLSGQDITPMDVTNPAGRTFTVPKCFVGVLDERTGMPLGPCQHRKEWDQ